MSLLITQSLPTELQKKISRCSLEANQILFQQGESAQFIFFLESGRLKLVSFTQQQMITHYYVEAGDSCAETSPYFDTYLYSAIADCPSQVLAVPKDNLLEALQHPSLSKMYFAHLIQRFHTLEQRLKLRSIRSARERIVYYLMNQLQPHHTTLTLEHSLKSIASEIGLAPEVLSRTLAQLQTEGAIQLKKRSITFNEEWLKDMVLNML